MSTEFLDPAACTGLAAGSLFYPSAGDDTDVPISAFRPWIHDFWFVDIHYDLSRPFTTSHRLEDDRHQVLTGTTLRTAERFEVVVRHERYR